MRADEAGELRVRGVTFEGSLQASGGKLTEVPFAASPWITATAVECAEAAEPLPGFGATIRTGSAGRG